MKKTLLALALSGLFFNAAHAQMDISFDTSPVQSGPGYNIYATLHAVDGSGNVVGTTNAVFLGPGSSISALNFYSNPTDPALSGIWSTNPSSCSCSWHWGDVDLTSAYSSKTVTPQTSTAYAEHAWDNPFGMTLPAGDGAVLGVTYFIDVSSPISILDFSEHPYTLTGGGPKFACPTCVTP